MPNVTVATFPMSNNNYEACKLGEPTRYESSDRLRRVTAMGHQDARCAWDARFESQGESSPVEATFLSSRQ